MKCEKCGGEWIPPKNISVSLTNCPFCGAPVLDADTAKGYTDMGEFLQYLVSLYGIDLYNNQRKLNNLIADLYQGDERMKRVYRRAILDDFLSKRIYDLSKKPLDEREAYYTQIINQFLEANFYAVDFGKQVIENFVSGLKLEIIAPTSTEITEKDEEWNNESSIRYIAVSTEATEEDGEWIDEFGVKYSADRKKLIRGFKDLKVYKVRTGTIIICDEAFSDCVSLTKIMIPNSVTNIGKDVFCNCKSVTNIIIPSSVTKIEDGTFYGCKSLIDITIPDSVTSLGEEVFWNCKSLTNITIPDSVTNIGYGSFCGCNNLIIILESYKYFIAMDGILYTSDMKKLLGCYSPKNKSISIPDSVISIEKYAFGGCESLMEVIIPSSVISIGDYAFSDCKSLKSIIIPNGEIGKFKDLLSEEYYQLLIESRKWKKRNRILLKHKL